MSTATISGVSPLVLVNQENGITVIPGQTQLARLNYFDGKFLRADDLTAEQNYLRSLVHLSNLAGGHGVVHGLDLVEDGHAGLKVGAGMAIDARGRVLLLPTSLKVGLAELIERSLRKVPGVPSRVTAVAGFQECTEAPSPPPGTVVQGVDLYVVTVGHAEALCGNEDVYGKLCEEACITSTARPYRLEGVVLRVVPLTLRRPLPQSSVFTLGTAHLRSRVAAAFFGDEADAQPHLISKDGLASELWCRGAKLDGQGDVPIGAIGVSGGTLVFLDPWIPRRERMESPPRRYWQWRMMMRPLNVFLAQVLQFQCQLAEGLDGPAGDGPSDHPCREAQRLVREAARHFDSLKAFYLENTERLSRTARTLRRRFEDELTLRGVQVAEVRDFGARLEQAAAAFEALPADRLLLRRGIVELPSAGYLPVVPGASVSVNQQVRTWMGEGVNLRFCIVRPDYVAHAFEEAQHLERISLLAGLENPAARPDVDILVPDGVAREAGSVSAGTAYEVAVGIHPALVAVIGQWSGRTETTDLNAALVNRVETAARATLTLNGVARSEGATGGAQAFYLGAAFHREEEGDATSPGRERTTALWAQLQTVQDPFQLRRNDSTGLSAEFRMVVSGGVLQADFKGDLILDEITTVATRTTVKGRIVGSFHVRMTLPSAAASSRVIEVSDTAWLLRDAADSRGATFDSLLARPSILGALARALGLRTRREWSSPTAARVEAVIQALGGQTFAAPAAPSVATVGTASAPLYTVDEKLNPDALRPGHPAREAASAALAVIAAAQKTPEFADLAGRKLFPPPAPATTDLVILAQRDWVLFHRRRPKQCSAAEAPSTPVRPRRYRVYGILLKTVEQVQRVAAAFASGEAAAIDALKPQLIHTVEFSAGLPSLESAPEELRSAWAAKFSAAGRASRLVYGAIASRGAALDEGETLARGRLSAFTRSLQPPTTVAGDAMLVTLDQVPTSIAVSVGEQDGVLIGALIPVPATCHQVFRWEAGTREVTEFGRAVQGASLARLRSILAERQMAEVGRTFFEEGTDQPLGEDPEPLVEAWSRAGGGTVAQVVVIGPRSSDPANPTPDERADLERRRSQAAHTSGQVGTVFTADRVIPMAPEQPGTLEPCRAITVLVVARPG